jgi:hypothetical protein
LPQSHRNKHIVSPRGFRSANLVLPIIVGGIGIGICVVPLTLSAIAGVGFDRIGPVSALTLMLQSLGGPLVLAVIQAVITSRTLYLGGTTGPVRFMNDAQLHALVLAILFIFQKGEESYHYFACKII